jgi:predicted dehydrogenase
VRDEQAFRVGVLGVGAIAQVVHLPILSELPRVRIQAICDADRPKAAAIADRFRVPRVCDEDDEVFESEEVDGILICTPSHMHESQAIAALEAGKHVLVEKPLALDPDAAQRVIAAAERTDRTLMVAMNNRYRPDAQALKPFGILQKPCLPDELAAALRAAKTLTRPETD